MLFEFILCEGKRAFRLKPWSPMCAQGRLDSI